MKSSFFLPWIYKHGDSLLASLIGFFIIYLFSRHGGIGLSPDSIAYLSTGRNLVAGKGFVLFDFKPLVAFPLFYPFFLSLVMRITHLDILVCAPFLNGLMFGSVIFLSGVIMSRFTTKSRIYKIIILTVISISPALIEIYTMLWSETLFILLSLIFYLAIHRYLIKSDLKWLLFTSVITAIAFDTRFAGLTLVAAGFILIMLNRNENIKKRVFHSILYVIVGCSLVIINLIHNELSAEYITGHRQKGITPLSDNLVYSARILSQWASLKGGNYYLEIALCIAVIFFFIWLFIINWQKKDKFASYENITIVFFVVYVSFIIITSTLARYEQINNRLLSPAFLPFLWGMSHKIPSLIKRVKQKKHQWEMSIVFIVIYGLVCIGYFSINAYDYSFMKDSGIPGYAEDDWRNSPTIRFLQANTTYFHSDSTIYSNHNQAIYLYTNYVAEALPEKVYKSDVKEFINKKQSILIWFKLDPNNDILSLNEIQKLKTIKVLHSFSDGTIYLLTNSKPAVKHQKHRRKIHYKWLSQLIISENCFAYFKNSRFKTTHQENSQNIHFPWHA